VGHAYLAAAPGRCRTLTICSAMDSELMEVAKRMGAHAGEKETKTLRAAAAGSKKKRR